MRLEKNGTRITCLDDWRRLAPPKGEHQWVEGRSAFELAHAWCGTGGPIVPDNLQDLLASNDATRGLVIELAIPEHRIPFDDHGGEPRNADLAFVGHVAGAKVAVTVEAKADEPFGATVSETIAAALERALENPASRGVRRVEDLVRALLGPHKKGQRHAGDLRYQLLTATAGSVAYAVAEDAPTAVLVVHEFVTPKTEDRLRARNADDYQAFLSRLGGLTPVEHDRSLLVGPFVVPGSPLFDHAPPLFVGKIVTDRRELGA